LAINTRNHNTQTKLLKSLLLVVIVILQVVGCFFLLKSLSNIANPPIVAGQFEKWKKCERNF